MKNIPVPRRDSRCTAERCLSMPRVDTTREREERARGNNVPGESDFKLKTRSLPVTTSELDRLGTRERRAEEKLPLFREGRAIERKIMAKCVISFEGIRRLRIDQARQLTQPII